MSLLVNQEILFSVWIENQYLYNLVGRQIVMSNANGIPIREYKIKFTEHNCANMSNVYFELPHADESYHEEVKKLFIDKFHDDRDKFDIDNVKYFYPYDILDVNGFVLMYFPYSEELFRKTLLIPPSNFLGLSFCNIGSECKFIHIKCPKTDVDEVIKSYNSFIESLNLVEVDNVSC